MNAPIRFPPPSDHEGRRHARPQPLDALFAPRTIAVIGASETAGSIGQALMQNLQGFDGHVFPINPKHRAVGGREAFPNLAAIPERADLAIIATRAPTVPALLRECAQAGVSAAVIISAGFREGGPAGVALEEQCLAEARLGRMRLLGPNCLGLMMPHRRLNASFAQGAARPGSVAFLSQSGALCSAVLDWSFQKNVGFSAFVSVGSMLDVGWGDLITHFGDDPHTGSIVCYMESVGDARAFLSAAREVVLNKPIIVLKVGHTSAAAKAAASHTGALAGSDAVLDAAFRRAGVVRVNTIAELFNLAELLSKQPRPTGPRLAIVTNAGGPGALATDALIGNGGQLATLAADTIESLDRLLPPHWSHRNPIDILGDADAQRYAKAVALAANDSQTDGILVILTPQAMTDRQGTAEALRALAPGIHKPLLTSWMGGAAMDGGRGILNEAGLPTFDYPDAAARAFALTWRHRDNLRLLYETPTSAPEAANPIAHSAPFSETSAVSRARPGPEQANALIAVVRGAGRTLLTEVESKQVLAAYGIPTTETQVALHEDEAVRIAETLGFPVVVKLFSETLTHKTDVGGVHLDVRNAKAVRQAWEQIRASVSAKAGSRHFLGVTVQPMAARDGYELILGSSIDPQFGPVLLFGTGGQLVEVFQDTALGLPPLNTTLARRLMEQTRIFTALQGVRGGQAADLESLAQLLVRFSHLISEQRGIAEVDINPLLVSPGRMLALDARILLHPAGTREESLPRPAIRPYPTHQVRPWKLRDGTPVTIRPIRPEDEPLLVKFHQALSDQSVYRRYFTPLKLDQRIAHQRLSRICFIDYDREMVLVVEHRDAKTHETEILGIGRLSKRHDANEGEFALIVRDSWQGRGLGTELLKGLVKTARAETLGRLTGIMLSDNHEMQRLARAAGFQVERTPGGNEYRAGLDL